MKNFNIYNFKMVFFCLFFTNCHPSAKDSDKANTLCKLIRDRVQLEEGETAAKQIFYSLRPNGKVVIIVKTNLISVEAIDQIAQSYKKQAGVTTVEVLNKPSEK